MYFNDDSIMCINAKVIFILLSITLFGCANTAFSEFPIIFCTPTEIIVVPDQYPTIQSAINAARESYVILVKPGTYVECITVDKSLRLVGSGANLSIIQNAGMEHTVKIKANNVVLKGFTIQSLEHGRCTGIYIRGSNCVIEDNFVTGHYYGIKIYDSSNNTLKNNVMSKNKYNFGVWGLFLSHFLHDIDFSNSVDGKPILYWINVQNRTVPLGVGYVALINSSRIIVRDLNISNNLSGVILAYTKDSMIINVTALKNERGLYLICSNNNVVVQNIFSNNEWSGITIVSSCNNLFVGNNITLNNCGVRLSHSVSLLNVLSENNTVIGNILSNNRDGLYIERSHNNLVKGNSIVNNTRSGIVLDESHGNIVKRNFVKNNKYGVWSLASKDLLYQNVFVNNSLHVYINPYKTTPNMWDNGYPIGGNFWSDHKGLDEKSGPGQEQLGSDGIIDIPYVIDANNKDRYPLLYPCTNNLLPIANFSQVPLEAKVGESILFIDESFDVDGQIILNIWKINGEYFWASKDVLIKSEEESICNVTLIVFDEYGATNTRSKNVFIRRLFSILSIFVPNFISLGEEFEISATLLDENGNPITGALINFYIVYNNTEMLIGSALTNLHGTATISHIIAKTGRFQIKALFLGNQKYTNTCASKDLVVKSSPHAIWIFWLFVAIFISAFLEILMWCRNKKKR